MYAIIETGSKQYTVSEGDVIRVEKLEVELGSTVEFDRVLLIGGDETKVGTPVVEGASVSGTVLNQGRDRKVLVYKYKPKKGFHKKNGHRQPYTEIKIDKITG